MNLYMLLNNCSNKKRLELLIFCVVIIGSVMDYISFSLVYFFVYYLCIV